MFSNDLLKMLRGVLPPMDQFKYNVSYKKSYTRIITSLLIMKMVTITIMYMYGFDFNINTLMYIFLIPLMIIPLFLTKDLMHPFNIFFINSEFLFVFNMIDINANKDSFRYGYLPVSYHDTAFFWAILVIIIWYVFMYFGYKFSSRMTTRPLSSPVFQVNNMRTISIILLVLGIISYTYMVSAQGGFAGIVDALSERREAYAGLGYFIKLTGLFPIGAIMLLLCGYKKTSAVLIFVSFLMLASFGGRAGAFFGSIFPFLICYHYRIKRLNIIKLIPLGFLAILFAIALGNYRLYQEIRINIDGLFGIISDIASGTQGGEILPSVVGSLIKGNIDYQYGSTLVNIIYAPIPSSIWSNKPIIDETGIVGHTLMGSDYWGLPPGPYGISFFNFGFIGVIIFSFIVGFIVYKLYYKVIINNNENGISIIIYALLITSVFNFISTSAQISILWYIGVFVAIKLLDVLIEAVKQDKRKLDKKHRPDIII